MKKRKVHRERETFVLKRKLMYEEEKSV